MPTTVLMPQMGYDMREGSVVKWRKQEGQEVDRGEVLAEIETDKAVVEMEALVGGTILKVVVPEGKTVPVGSTIAFIGKPGEEIPDVKSAESTTEPESPKPPKEKEITTSTAPPKTETSTTKTKGPVRASPVARRIAKEKGIDLALVNGTGPGGRIVEKDLIDYESQPDELTAKATSVDKGGKTAVDLSRMRQAIARITSESKQQSPHFYVSVDVDMSRAMALRKQINEELKNEMRVSVNDLIIQATTKSLGNFPNFNSSFKDNQLEVYSYVNMGIAISLEEGLIVPAIPNCENKSLLEIAKASSDLGTRAREGKLSAEEYTGGTFSVSNLGMFNVDSFAAIIFPPNAAVLAVGSVKSQPVVKEGNIQIAEIMKTTISVDHRVADGAEAAKFITEVKRYLEQPMLLLV